MKLILVIVQLLSLNLFADIVISKDTTVNNTWTIPATTILQFTTGGHISGSGTISGGIIQAALNQNIFDTLLTVNPSGIYDGKFSGRWFGANPVNSDNSQQLQKAINSCMDKFWLFIPAGIYNYRTTLTVNSIDQGLYVGCTLRMTGETTYWTANNEGTVLIYTPPGSVGFALALQLNKGTEIGNITLLGNYVSPNTSDTVYFNTSYTNYIDQSSHHYTTQYRGLCIDYTSNQNGSQSGSTGVYVHDFIVGGFSTLIAISRNGTTLNGDVLRFERIQLRDGNTGFMSCQGQEKGNLIDGLYSWGSIHTIFSSGNEVNGQGGNYFIKNINVAGRCVRPFWCNQNGWGMISITDGFFEGIATIGTLSTGSVLAINNCTFDFAYPSAIGYQTLVGTNGDGTRFTNCIFRYFGVNNLAQNFVGVASFDNCSFNGVYTNTNPSGKVFINTSSLPPVSVKVIKSH